jgi:maltooligosyltrehalose trehalohydrolase
VRTGRREEFAQHGWDTDDIPDPQSPETFRASKLDWGERHGERGERLISWTRDLIALRRRLADLSDGRRDRVEVTYDEAARWLVVRRGRTAVACNLAPTRQQVPLPSTPDGMLLASEHGFVFKDALVELDGESVAILDLLA